MGRSTREKSDIVSAAGYTASWWTALGKAGAKIGLKNEDYYPLGEDAGEVIAANVAAQLATLRDRARPKPSVRAKPEPTRVYVSLVDKDVPSKCGAFIEAYRKMGFDDPDRYGGPVAWRDPGGFTLKQHAPLAGPCHQGFDYLQDWTFQNDAPTRSGIVFWIPRLLTGSTGKTVDEQRLLMATTRTQYGLPEHHLRNFGSAALLSGLVLAHHKLTHERVPLRGLWARSDTFRSGGSRLSVGGFGEAGLCCDAWGWVGERFGNLGAFPLGEELDP